MNMNWKINKVVLLACLIGNIVSAQEKWTLDNCVDYAISHNLQLKDFQYNADSGKETYRQSIRNLLPTIDGSSSYTINFGRSTDPFTNDVVTTDFFSNNYSLESSVALFQGFQRLNSIKASKFLYKATQEETLQQKYLLAFRVMQAFYDIEFFEGLVSISNEQLQVSETNLELVQKQIELGLMAGADLYEAESLLLTDSLNLTQSENQLAAAKLRLIQEMNLEGTTDITIQSDLTKKAIENRPLEVGADSIYTETLDFLPILKASNLRAKAARKQLGATRGQLYPSLSLFGGVGTGYFETTRDTLGVTVPFREQFRDNTFQFIGVSLNIPISNRWSRRSAVKQQKIERLRAKNNLEVQEQLVYQTIQTLVQEHDALYVEYTQTIKNLEAQRLAFAIAQKRYEKGLINAIELFTAKNLFANAQNQHLQVKLRSEVNKSTLDFYRGLPVFNIN